MSQDVFILCQSVLNAVPHLIVAGSTKTVCAFCVQEVWKAKTTEIILAQNPGAKIICEECFMEKAKEQSFEIAPMTQAQFDEMGK